MRLLLAFLSLPVLLCLPATVVAEMSVIGDIGITGGYTENLLKVSDDIGDSYATYSGSVRFYPFPELEANGRSSYTHYSKTSSLNNFSTGVGFILIPTREGSPLSSYLTASFDGQRYREALEAFDNNRFEATASAGYRLLPAVGARMGLTWRSTSYIISESHDKENWEVFTGLNVTPFGRNSFDVELGYGTTHFNSVPVGSSEPPFDFYVVGDPDSLLTGASLQSLYVGPRYSRPLGYKTGLNINYMFRTFMNSEQGDGIVIGTSIGLLSPWTSVWEGHLVALNLKSFLIPTVMLTAGISYSDKTFLSTLEDVFPDGKGSYVIIVKPVERQDEQRNFYLQAQRPFSTPLGVLQPQVRVGYEDNKSTNDLFDYHGFTFSAGINYQL
jgi:hypothetical protein